ncbi:MAG TPA: peptidase U32 family protein [Bacteroidales bacterium]|nr:peptidase U32 family protein [Bacteroidales bacterium]
MKRSEIEIMAPVGSYESLMAAIQGKADAVYFGIGKLNMRSKSTLNFTADDLKNIVEICHANNMKAYITLNTVMYDEDIAEMRQVLDYCKANNVDAVIASDLAALLYAKEIGLDVHISTQQNISNAEAVNFFAQYADVMVMARELDLKQVKAISRSITDNKIQGPGGKPIRLEMFAHGALCMAISGKCYLSLHEYNHSANRGACFQICRRSYTVTDNETKAQLEIDNEYIMSPKDLCTIGFIDKIIDAGVKVLKIEGRARSAEYVKTVCYAYHKALLALENGTYDKALIDELTAELSTVYNRGFWDGYYLGRRLGEWSESYGSKATKKKVYVGKVTNYFSKLSVAEILMETNEVSIGDELLIMGPSTGVIEITASEIRVELKNAEKAVKGQYFSMLVPNVVRRSDKLYKLVANEEL